MLVLGLGAGIVLISYIHYYVKGMGIPTCVCVCQTCTDTSIPCFSTKRSRSPLAVYIFFSLNTDLELVLHFIAVPQEVSVTKDMKGLF